MTQLAGVLHPNVVDRLCVSRTEFWAQSLGDGEKVTLGHPRKELVISNVAVADGSESANLQVLTDGGMATLASLTKGVPNSKVWFRVRAGQRTTITARKGGLDVLGHWVSDEPDVDPDAIVPPMHLQVDDQL